MSKKSKKTDEPKDDGPKGPSCRYFHEHEYVWIGNEKQGYYTIGGLHPCRFLDALYALPGISLNSRLEAEYRTKFYDSCWYWLTSDIARARLDLLVDQMANDVWQATVADGRSSGLSERDVQTGADKALEAFYAKIPAANTLFDKPRGRR